MSLYFPDKAVIGDTLIWEIDSPRGPDPATGDTINYDPAEHTIAIAMRGATALDVTADDDNGTYKVTVPSATSATLQPGIYLTQVTVTDTSANRRTVERGMIEALMDLPASTGIADTRSTYQRQLDEVNAAISKAVAGGVQEWSLGMRAAKRYTLDELRRMRDDLLTKVAKENRTDSGRRLVHFERPYR